MKTYYGLAWDRYGAAQSHSGKLLASVFMFGSRAEREHWVEDSPTQYTREAYYRWAATRRDAQRCEGWEERTGYLGECSVCGSAYDDDCEAERCAQHDLMEA